MRILLQNRLHKMKPAIFLAVALPILLAVSGLAQAKPDTKSQSSPVRIVTGTAVVDVEGPSWKLHYGSPSQLNLDKQMKTSLAVAENGTAWFSHGGWLRLIDVKKGMVMGRWHFTDIITNLVIKGDAVEVEYKMESDNYNSVSRKVLISLQTKKSDFVNPNNFLLVRIPLGEAERYGEFGFFSLSPDAAKKVERARKLLPEYEDMARRDPTAPFILAAYGTFLKDLGDTRAESVLRAATIVESSDFTELLSLSGYLDSIGEPALARDAFERGYRDFLERGNDPRMFYIIFGRLTIYRLPAKRGEIEPAARKEILEREYRIGPHMEAAYLAWTLYARELQTHGDAAAALWKERAEDSAREEVVSWCLPVIDWMLLLCFGGLLGSLLFLVVQWIRYLPQRRLAAAKGIGSTLFSRLMRVFSYWSHRERYVLAAMIAISWYALGLMMIYTTGEMRLASTPVNMWMGSLGSPQAIGALERLPESSARNFLLALAHQQAGDPETSLRIYLGQPQYAQAWNNLGVIYKNRGEEAKAKEAFEKALQVDSGLNEAKLNLGQPTTDLWTSQYRSYFPGKAMIAPPSGMQVREAYLGTSGAGLFLRAAAGPLLGKPRDLAELTNEARLPVPILLISAMLLGLTLLLVFVLPYHEVTEAPPRWLGWLEMLIPGTSRSWGWFASGALIVWGTFLVGAFVMTTSPVPFILATMWMPNLMRVYNVAGTMQDVWRLLSPHWTLMYLLPAVLFISNAALVLRQRRVKV